MRRTQTSRRPTVVVYRKGFTLIEILVVITIIGILTAIVTLASVGFIGQARTAATRATIKKVDEAILERVSAVDRWHKRPISRLRHDWQIRGWPNRWLAHGLDPFSGTGANQQGSDDVKFVLSRKGMLMELLPVTREELAQAYWFWAQYDTDGVINYEMVRRVPVPYLSADEKTAMNAVLADLDRPGEVFFYALLNAPVFGGLRVLEEDFKPSELTDPDNDGHLELADAWGNPLYFYRWPTRLVNDGELNLTTFRPTDIWRNNVGLRTLIPNAPGEDEGFPRGDLHQDPDDRTGFLSVPNPVYGGIFISTFFHDPDTWHSPLVVSAGPDGRLGMDEPSMTYPIGSVPRTGLAGVPNDPSDPSVRQRALEELYDNISNHNGSGSL